MLNKKSGLHIPVRERYEHFRARCSTNVEFKTKENGCIHPLKGQKSKCVLQIVPDDTKCNIPEQNMRNIIKKYNF